MAQAGSTYEKIIQHYYTGVRLAQAAGLRLPGVTVPAVASEPSPPGTDVAFRGEDGDRGPAL
jgi:hypothetical protein